MRMMLAGAILLLGAALFAWLTFSGPAAATRSYSMLAAPGSDDRRLNLFMSGHSLMDRPMPDFLAGMARNAGLPVIWNRQHLNGSSIRQRSLGGPGEAVGAGFAAGTDRDDKPIDVREALRHPATPDGRPYDLLLITEQHRLLDSLLWQDSLRSLRTFQDVFIAANPDGVSAFFVPWLDLSDRRDPAGWIAYERSAWPVWQCAVASVNDSLAADGRSDRVTIIPASLALAALVEHLAQTPDAAGFAGLTVEERIATLFADRVHLTPLGSDFIAAVTVSALYGRSMVSDDPAGLDLERAKTLRHFAEGFVTAFRARAATFGQGCRPAGIPWRFALGYAAYVAEIDGDGTNIPVLSQLRTGYKAALYAWRLKDALPRTAAASVEGGSQ